MNVVIVAGGLGTRFKDLSVFPKVLLPLANNDSVLEKDLEILGDHIYLIVNEKFYDMTMDYLRANNLSDKVIVLESINTNGSYNTIKDCIDNYVVFPKKDVLFVWSDLILSFRPNVTKNTIFTYDGDYRYSFDGNQLYYNFLNGCGNVPGVYYIEDLDKVFTTECDAIPNHDLVDAFVDSGVEIEKQDLSYVFELRDKETYERYASLNISSILKTRFFNRLTVEGNTLTKEAIDPKYYEIIEKEFNWYQYGYNHIDGFWRIVPNVDLKSYKDHSFKMEYLKNYMPLHKVLKQMDSEDQVQELYRNIKSALDILNTNIMAVSRGTFEKDLKKEVIDKVFARCENIKHMLIEYDDFEMVTLLEKAYEYLLDLEKNDTVNYSFIHGDINGSNMLVDPITLDVKLIDPRGYFGNTRLYGWKPYEYAKLLYCLYGYDDFNINLQIYKRDWPKKLEWAEDIDWLNKKEYKVLVGVIYVALAGYISQDIMKANIAYEYGMKLLRKELEDVQ